MTPLEKSYLSRKNFIESLYCAFCKSNNIQYFNDYSIKLVKAYSSVKEEIRAQLSVHHNIDYHKIISGTQFTIFSFLGIKPNSQVSSRITEWQNNKELISQNINFALFVSIMILHKWTNIPMAQISETLTKENFKKEHKKWLYRIVKKIHNNQNHKSNIDLNDVYALSQIWYLLELNCKKLVPVS
jgi:hypothetical protein